MIKIMIVDDQKILIDSLKILLEQEPNFTVVGSAENGIDAFEVCKNCMPDVILMDISMPLSDGIEGTKLIKEAYKDIKVVILSTYNDVEKVRKALAYGADGYLQKDVRSNELINAIKSVVSGISIIDKNTLNTVSRELNSVYSDATESSIDVEFPLSDKEKEFLKILATGKINKEIAAHFNISESSVKNTLSKLLKKSNMDNRIQLVLFATKNKLI